MAIDWKTDPLFGRILTDFDAAASQTGTAIGAVDTTATNKMTELMSVAGGSSSGLDLSSIGDINYPGLITST